jgi:hypothetical protein
MSRSVKTKSGRVLKKSELDALADEAERGFDLRRWRPRRGRPSLAASDGAHSPRIAVRVPEALRRQVAHRAEAEGRTVSEVVRDLLEKYAAS